MTETTQNTENQQVNITAKESFCDYTYWISFTFNGVSYRTIKTKGTSRFSPFKVNATGELANLDLSDELKIEIELQKQTKFI